MLLETFFLALLAGANSQPFVETYWETWIYENYPNDYCAELKEVPASPVGSNVGTNVINIAFGDYSGGLGGIECEDWIVREGIQAVHEKGGKVKVAYGGALYSMSFYITNEQEADQFCSSVLEMKNDYGVDGIDLDVEDGGTDADLQIYVIKQCRQLLGNDFLITYTIPALVGGLEPWSSTLSGAAAYLDAVNVMAYDYYWPGYNFTLDLDALNGLGYKNEKIVYGIMPGRHDAGNEYTSLEDADDVAAFVLAHGLGGVMTWDINRDCDQRMNFPQGEDNLYQTGKPKGAYVNYLSNRLNSP